MYLFYPLFVAGLPMFGLVPLANYIGTVESIKDFKYVVLLALPCAVFLWLALGLFGVQRRQLYHLQVFLMCLFFAFPFGFLYPLGSAEVFGENSSSAKTAAISLIG